MKIVSEQSNLAQRIRKVEELLREQGVSITSRGDGLLIAVDRGDGTESSCVMLDGESKDIQQVFPTDVEPTVIQKIEHYISGV